MKIERANELFRRKANMTKQFFPGLPSSKVSPLRIGQGFLICRTFSHSETYFSSSRKYATTFFGLQFGSRQNWALNFAAAKLPSEKDPLPTLRETGVASRGRMVRPTDACNGIAFGSVMKPRVSLESEQRGVFL